MKKLVILLLLGVAIIYLNSDNFTSRVTQALNASSKTSDRDEQLHERLASIDEMRALEEKVERLAPVLTSVQDTTIATTSDTKVVEVESDKIARDSGDGITLQEAEASLAQAQKTVENSTDKISQVSSGPSSQESKPPLIEPNADKNIGMRLTDVLKSKPALAPVSKDKLAVAQASPNKVEKSGAVDIAISESDAMKAKPQSMETTGIMVASAGDGVVPVAEEKYEVKNLPYTKIYTPIKKVAKSVPAPVSSRNVSSIPEFARHEQVPVVDDSVLAANKSLTTRTNPRNRPSQSFSRDTGASEKTWYVTVRKGDTLSKIAKRVYGNPGLYRALAVANRNVVKNEQYIYPGQILKIPGVQQIGRAPVSVVSIPSVDTQDRTSRVKPVALTPRAQFSSRSGSARTKTIIVKPGDTLSKIAERYFGNFEVYKTLYSINRSAISDPNLIYPGQEIRIPAG